MSASLRTYTPDLQRYDELLSLDGGVRPQPGPGGQESAHGGRQEGVQLLEGVQAASLVGRHQRAELAVVGTSGHPFTDSLPQERGRYHRERQTGLAGTSGEAGLDGRPGRESCVPVGMAGRSGP